MRHLFNKNGKEEKTVIGRIFVIIVWVGMAATVVIAVWAVWMVIAY